MSLQVVCPSCGNRLPVDDSLIGKQIRCGGCAAVIEVPRTPAEPTRAVAAQPIQTPVQPDIETLEVICTCRVSLTVPVSAKGTRMRCPRCQSLIYIPSESAPTPNAPSVGFPNLAAIGAASSRAKSLPGTAAQNPYRRPPPAKSKSNKPIVVMAIVGFAALLLVIGAAVAMQFWKDYQVASAETAADEATASVAADAAKTVVTSQVGNSTKQGSDPADQPGHDPVGMNPSDVAPTRPKATSTTPDKQPLSVVLAPGDEQGMRRIHLPEGYSIALPPGFQAAPRAINGMTAIYQLGYADRTSLIFQVTDDRSITPDTPVADDGLGRRQSTDGKIKVMPLMSEDDPNRIETFKLDGMNACFAAIEMDVSHPDRTEEINRLYSGAIPAEAKFALRDQMRAVTAFEAVFVMKAMGDQRTLEVVMKRTSNQPISPPPQWFNIIRTIRHEEPPDRSRIPAAFVK